MNKSTEKHVSSHSSNTNVVGIQFKSREIKFRFWLGHTKKMTYEHSLIEIAHLFWDFTEDILPLQYTGLKDKNGNEIYEGDILRTETDKPMVVGWSNKFASFVLERDGWAFQHWFGEAADPEYCEIVGNVFENPELLETLR